MSKDLLRTSDIDASSRCSGLHTNNQQRDFDSSSPWCLGCGDISVKYQDIPSQQNVVSRSSSESSAFKLTSTTSRPKKPAVRSRTASDERSSGLFRTLSNIWRPSPRSLTKKNSDPLPWPKAPGPQINFRFQVQSNKLLSLSKWTEYSCSIEGPYINCYNVNGRRPMFSVSLIAGYVECCSTKKDLLKGRYLVQVVPKEKAGTNGDLKPVVFCCYSEQAMEKWVDAIQNAIKKVTEAANNITNCDIKQERKTVTKPRPKSLKSAWGEHSKKSEKHPFSRHTLSNPLPYTRQDEENYVTETELFSCPCKTTRIHPISPMSNPGECEGYYINEEEVNVPSKNLHKSQEEPHVYVPLFEDGNATNKQVIYTHNLSNDERIENTEVQSGLLPPTADVDKSEAVEYTVCQNPVSEADSQSVEVAHEGWLYRRAVIRNVWSDCYCCLTNGMLYLYKNETEKMPVVSMTVSGCHIDFVYQKKGRHVFQVKSAYEGKARLLATETGDDRMRWVNALKRAATIRSTVVAEKRESNQESHGRDVGKSQRTTHRQEPQLTATSHVNEIETSV